MAEKLERTIYIKWIRSGIGFPRKQKRVMSSLGLSRLNQVVERPDTPHIRGMVASVPHLVSIVEKPPEAGWRSDSGYRIVPRSESPVPEKVNAPAEAAVTVEPAGETPAES